MTTVSHLSPAPESDLRSCVVIFSGGQDSTTCLFWARQKFQHVHALFFRYGQRHATEEDSAREIARRYDFPLNILNLETFREIGGNSLTDPSQEIRPAPESGGLPNTFVPGRNLIFLTYAGAWAWKRNITDLVTGVCETDYSGYPDCRETTIKSLEQTISLGMDRTFHIHTPLMHLSKAQTVQLADDCGGLPAMAWTHTCYEGLHPPCGKCPSCLLRAKGFSEAGISDPLLDSTTRRDA